ncbi:MAG: hypothetical protein ACE5G3_04415, partial [Gammaproteobacteria bacterium]
EMDTDTVPGAVIAAVRRAGQTNGGRDGKWGVTLPAGTRGELDRYLTGSAGGALVIDANGHLRLER